jgi:L-ribulokinase
VLPGYIGLEAGQSGFGDIYAWFKRVLAWPVEELIGKSSLIDETQKTALIEETLDKIIPVLSEQAAALNPFENTVFATDWLNGRRTPDANQLVQGTISGLTLGSSAPMIFRALVEATAFGSKAIVDRFVQEGVRIDRVIGIGGISLKSPFVMQTMADVLNKPIKVAKSDQACAFGASMFAAVAAGIYSQVEEAQQAMGQGFACEYIPNPGMAAWYEKKYPEYLLLGQLTEENFFNTIEE